VVVAANDAARTQWRIPMARLTDTQLIILSAASQRDDRGVELPANLKGEAARKVVATLIRARLLEEVRSAWIAIGPEVRKTARVPAPAPVNAAASPA